MRFLLDTHIYLWVVKNDRRLTKAARTKIENADEVYVSSATIWEAAIKIKIGKLDVDIDDLTNAISESGFLELPVTARQAALVVQLPDYHRDPFDRILIAQAMSEPLRLLTADAILREYSDLIDIV